MKPLVAFSGTLLMLAALAARAAGERSKDAVAPAATLREAAVEPTPVAPAATKATVEKAVAPAASAVEPSPVLARTERVSGPSMPSGRAVAAQLVRELGLSPAQLRAVEAILDQRDVEIEAYFEEIRARKVASLEEWARRIEGIKEGTYRRIDALLEAQQQERFIGLLERRALNDTIAFRIPDDVVNLDDAKD